MAILLILGIICVLMAVGLAVLAFIPGIGLSKGEEMSFPDIRETAEEASEETKTEEETSGISSN